jgi:hypothetical protein
MQSSFRRVHRSAFALSLFLLVLVLSACGPFTSSQTPTPTPTPPPTTQPKASPSPAATSGFTIYNGDGFTIEYPVGWSVSGDQDNILFQDPTTIYNLDVKVTNNPEGIVSTTNVVNIAVAASKTKLKNPQNENVPATVRLGGDNWSQKSVSGTTTENGQSVDVQVFVLADNHPASSPSTQSFAIVYATAKQLVSVAEGAYFQHMLQSFKFT